MEQLTRYSNSIVKKATKNGILTKKVNIVLAKLAEINKDYDLEELQVMYCASPDKQTVLEGFREIIKERA